MPMLSGTTATALLAGLLVGTAALAAAPGGPSRRLQQRIARTVGPAGRGTRPQAQAPTTVRRQNARTMLGQTGTSLARLLPRAEAMRRRLDLAGITLNVVDHVLICVMAGTALGLAAHLALGLPWPIAAAIAVIAATGLPHLLLQHLIARRKRLFRSQFPDAIDLIVRGVRSGLPVAEALQAVGQELPNQVGGLFREVTGNVKLGKTLDEALTMAARMIDLQVFKFFMISLTIQQETGGNLGEILYNLGALMRRREQVKLKIKAMSSEARASALIIGSLPFVISVVIFVIDPNYILKLFLDPRGWMLLAAGLTSLSLGLGIMAKMVRFEI